MVVDLYSYGWSHGSIQCASLKLVAWFYTVRLTKVGCMVLYSAPQKKCITYRQACASRGLGKLMSRIEQMRYIAEQVSDISVSVC